MARFLDNLLRLLNRLVEPSTQADDPAAALSKADALNALAESGDFRIVLHLLPFFAKGDALSRQAAQVTISADTNDKLRRARDLLRHTIPDGDIAAILDRALTVLLADVEKRGCGAATIPRQDAEPAGHPRHIPSAVKREVWHRDEGRCAFVRGTRRCAETAFLEFHHVVPYADGGAATVRNIELRCRAHNQYEAVLFFGDGSDAAREQRVVW